MKPADDLDKLQLARRRTQATVRFGDVDVSYATSGATTRSAVNEMPDADVKLDYSLVAGQPVDYLAPVTLSRSDGSHEHHLFSGSVIEAVPAGAVAEIHCQTNPSLGESLVGLFVSANAVGPEIIHLMARAGGLREDQIHVEDLDRLLPVESIEVIAPVRGLGVATRTRLGRVVFVTSDSIRDIWMPLASGSDLAMEQFEQATACAVVVQAGRRLLDAETAALSHIDDTLAWMSVRSRYGLALLPDGRAQRFRRSNAVSNPARKDLVVVRGLQTQRSWLRQPSGAESHKTILVDDLDHTWSVPERPLPMADRQAVLALADAARSGDTLRRVQSLWEAVEFYVQGTKLPRFFLKSEVRRARKALPEDLDPALAKRLEQLFANVNEPSLMAKLQHTVRADGVPITSGELELLKDLRDRRNDAVHGRVAALPDADAVDHAVSVVARMIVYRLRRNRR